MTLRSQFCFAVAVLIATVGFARDRHVLAENVGQRVDDNSEATGKCPIMSTANGPSQRHTAAGAYSNRDWWPNQLNLDILHQNSAKSNPLGKRFQLRRRVQEARPRRREKGHRRVDDRLRRIGGRPTTGTTGRCSFGWPGTVLERIASPTAGAAPAMARCVSLL